MPLGCGLIYKYLIGTHFAQNISICVASGAGKPAPHAASAVLGRRGVQAAGGGGGFGTLMSLGSPVSVPLRSPIQDEVMVPVTRQETLAGGVEIR